MVLETLLDKYKADKEHAFQVAKLALMIFDKMKELELHNMSDKKRTMLKTGSILHDIGYFTDAKGHNKHSFSLIKDEVLDDFDEEQKAIIACIARYHRGSLPKNRHPEFASLNLKGQKTLLKLAGITRLSDGLDRRHICAAEDIELKYCKKHNILWMRIVSYKPFSKSDIKDAINKKDLFEKAFSLQLVLLRS